jgi:hypothetical protein
MSLRWSFGLFGGQTTKMPALRALKNPCSSRVSTVAKIQTPLAPVVHPKMNSGKETVAHAEFGMRDARKAVLKPPHSKRWRDHQASPHRAKRLDCARVHRRFSPGRPSQIVHLKMILAAAVFFAWGDLVGRVTSAFV